MAGEPRDAAEHLQGEHVDVGALSAPVCNDAIDLIGLATCLHIMNLDIERLLRQTYLHIEIPWRR
jgi:hypothetical protein